MKQGSNNLHFFYDAQNKPAIVVYNGTAYAYLYSLQGDVIGLLDRTGTKIVSYTYDAWGKPISKTGTLASTLGTIQPFRYRGYVYDEETGIYYLCSRYYNSTWSRFLNADSEVIVEEDFWNARLFTYCANNPVRYEDTNGQSFWDTLKKVAEAALVVAAVAIVVAAVIGTGGGAGLALAGGGVLTSSAASSALMSAATVIGAAGATAWGLAHAGIFFSKPAKRSDKDKANDKLSWVNRDMVNPKLSAQQNATNMMNSKYGIGNWKPGPSTEFNKIVKWIQRSLFKKITIIGGLNEKVLLCFLCSP